MDSKLKKNDIINKDSSVFIATFSHYQGSRRMPRNGMVDPMLSFFLPKVKALLLLDQPHPISDTINPIVEIYSKGERKKRFIFSSLFYLPIFLLCKIPSKSRTRISYKLRDFFSVIFIALTQKEKYDLFIGLEAINALAGIILRKIGKVEKVVYYVSDYSPTRFGQTLFNALYLWLDRFCVRHADFTWDVSPAMKKGRIEAGLPERDMKRVLHVPNGLFTSQIESLSIPKRITNSLVYLGSLDDEFGVDLAIRALNIVRREKPSTTLRIIGGGGDLPKLKALVKKLNMENSVTFYGFVEDNNEMAKIVRTSYLGLAPYRAFKDSYCWYGDAGKIRQYVASGLPVVTTQVPPLGAHIVNLGAGIMAKDTVDSFSKEIIKLLLDKDMYMKLSDAAEKISKDNTWENVYTKALRDMEKMNRA